MDYIKAKEILKNELQGFQKTGEPKGFFISSLINDIKENEGITDKTELISWVGGVLSSSFTFRHTFNSIFKPTKKVVDIKLLEDGEVVLHQGRGTKKWTDFTNDIVKYIGIKTFRKLDYDLTEYKTKKEIEDKFSYKPIQIEKDIWLCQQQYAGDGRHSAKELTDKLNEYYKYEKYELRFEDEETSRTFNTEYKK